MSYNKKTAVFPGIQTIGNPTLTASTFTARRKGDLQHCVEEINKKQRLVLPAEAKQSFEIQQHMIFLEIDKTEGLCYLRGQQHTIHNNIQMFRTFFKPRKKKRYIFTLTAIHITLGGGSYYLRWWYSLLISAAGIIT